MGARRQRSRHLAAGQPIAGHRPLEQLDRHRLRPVTLQSVAGGTMDNARGPLPQQFAQCQRVPIKGRDMGIIDGPRLLPLAKGVAGIGEPGEARQRQRQQPVGEAFDPVGGDAQQLQTTAVDKARGQFAQAVARQHQLLQGIALTQLIGQPFNDVVGQDQPAQPRRQRFGRHGGNPVGLKAHHGEQPAAPQHLGQRCKAVLGAKEDAQFGEPSQLVRKRA